MAIWTPAEPMVRAYLLQHGNQIEAMRLLARIGIARKVFDDAELLLAAVLELAPDYRAARARIRRGAHRTAQIPAGARGARAAAARESGQPALLSEPLCHRLRWAWASTSGRSSCTVSCCRRPRGRRPAPVDGARAEDAGPARGGHRVLPPGGRLPRRTSAMPTGASPTSRPTASRTRSWRGMRALQAEPTIAGRSIAIICVLRSARRSRTGASMPNRSAATSRAMR